MRSDPNLDLFETFFQPLLEFNEGYSMFRQVRHVHEKPRKIIAEGCSLVFP